MTEQPLKNILEGALLAAGRPLSLDDLQALFDEDQRPERDAIRAALQSLQEGEAERSFVLKEVASGYRLQVKRELSPWVSRLWMERPSRYSRALLETLALVAYRQPITRGEIEDIRGVSVSSSIMKTLQEREWIRVVGHRDVPGKPAMYGTTKQFLDYFDLKSLDELPTLAELRDIDSINAELDLRAPGEAPSGESQIGENPDAEYLDDEAPPASATLETEADESDALDVGADQDDREPVEASTDGEPEAAPGGELGTDEEAGEIQAAASAGAGAPADTQDAADDETDPAEQAASSTKDSETTPSRNPEVEYEETEDNEDADAAGRWRENG